MEDSSERIANSSYSYDEFNYAPNISKTPNDYLSTISIRKTAKFKRDSVSNYKAGREINSISPLPKETDNFNRTTIFDKRFKFSNISKRRDTVHAKSKLEHYDAIMENQFNNDDLQNPSSIFCKINNPPIQKNERNDIKGNKYLQISKSECKSSANKPVIEKRGIKGTLMNNLIPQSLSSHSQQAVKTPMSENSINMFGKNKYKELEDQVNTILNLNKTYLSRCEKRLDASSNDSKSKVEHTPFAKDDKMLILDEMKSRLNNTKTKVRLGQLRRCTISKLSAKKDNESYFGLAKFKKENNSNKDDQIAWNLAEKLLNNKIYNLEMETGLSTDLVLQNWESLHNINKSKPFIKLANDAMTELLQKLRLSKFSSSSLQRTFRSKSNSPCKSNTKEHTSSFQSSSLANRKMSEEYSKFKPNFKVRCQNFQSIHPK